MNPSNRSDLEKSAQEKLDRQFEDFLRDDGNGVSALYRKLPRAEPDAQLDARVLAHAHDSLREDLPRTLLAAAPVKRARPAWLPALSAAAVMLLAAGIAWRAGPQMWTSRDAAAPAASATSARTGDGQDAVSSMAKSAANAQSEPPRSAPPPVAAPPVASPQQLDDAPVAAPTAKPGAPSTAMPAPERFHADVAKRAANEAMPRRNAGDGKPSAFPTRSTDLATPQPAPAAAAPPASPSLNTSGAAAFNGNAVPSAAPSAPMPAIAQPAPIAAPMPQAAPPSPANGPVPESRVEPASASADGASKPVLEQQKMLSPQAQWIERIRGLLRQQHRDGALRNLRDFRKQYPDYALPADLRDLQ